MTWAPHVTVATVVEKQGRFLLVRERPNDREVYNQPAGHLEEGETLEEAALRETLEETGWQVKLTGLLGIGLYLAPANGVTYVRHTFIAEPVTHLPEQTLDDGILAAEWLSYAEILERRAQLRSPMVLDAVDEFLSGQRYPLEMLRSYL
ncbi:NUDIX hydrolase [Marinimicrobium sp. ABcell2]|uniref:NUDIX hydrolase n=1 Tax=Marinimicrobium sp. ABcell2 TaxID=3069751 RepID=UPI0027B1B36D|nr:NUDIX hydrolase [Marinimicrobium sp. ABcell2]MDQ2077229.1 NUDIX hydrolase [Marinimicrobium sp. ABcell2]